MHRRESRPVGPDVHGAAHSTGPPDRREAGARERDRLRRAVFGLVAERILEEVGQQLDRADIPWAPIKGVVLARWLYANPEDRPYVDVDLLVTREGLTRARALVAGAGWRVFYSSPEKGELGFFVEGLPVELHAEIGRVDLTTASAEEVLARATLDTQTFGFRILHLDDVDHFLVVATNALKDGFVYANSHQPEDLTRMLTRVALDDVVLRAEALGLTTGLYLCALWIRDRRPSERFEELERRLAPGAQRLLPYLFRFYWRKSRRNPVPLVSLNEHIGWALACLAPDDPARRMRSFARLIRRGVDRKLGRDPG